jgi:hypothetical protein
MDTSSQATDQTRPDPTRYPLYDILPKSLSCLQYRTPTCLCSVTGRPARRPRQIQYPPSYLYRPATTYSNPLLTYSTYLPTRFDYPPPAPPPKKKRTKRSVCLSPTYIHSSLPTVEHRQLIIIIYINQALLSLLYFNVNPTADQRIIYHRELLCPTPPLFTILLVEKGKVR